MHPGVSHYSVLTWSPLTHSSPSPISFPVLPQGMYFSPPSPIQVLMWFQPPHATPNRSLFFCFLPLHTGPVSPALWWAIPFDIGSVTISPLAIYPLPYINVCWFSPQNIVSHGDVTFSMVAKLAVERLGDRL